MSRWQGNMEQTGITNTSIDNTSSWSNISGDLSVELEDTDPGEDYIILSNGIYGGSNTGYNGHEIRIRGGSTNLVDSIARYEPAFSGTSDGFPFQYIRKYTSPDPSVDIRPQHRTRAALAGRTASHARGNWWLMRLQPGLVENTDWFYTESFTDLTALDDTAWVDGVSVTIGDGVSDYAVWSHGMINGNSVTNDIRHRIFDGTTGFMEMRLEHEDTTEVIPIGTCMYFAAPSASTVIKNQWRADNSTSPSDVTFNSIFVLRLSAFEDHAGVHDTDITTVTPLDTDTIVQTLTHTSSHAGGQDRWWMSHGAYIADQGATNKRMDCVLQDTAQVVISPGTTDRASCNRDTDRMSVGIWGHHRHPDATDLDIDLVAQEESNLGTPGVRVVESVIIAYTLQLANPSDSVNRVSEWKSVDYNDTPSDTVIIEDNMFPINTPTTGPTGDVDIGTGSNRLFLFIFTAEDDPVTVSAFTIGGVTYTGTFQSTQGSGSSTQHVYFFWWDEAAIDSMSGLAISWTDDRSLDDAHHTWATFVNVDQNDPVPSGDQSDLEMVSQNKGIVSTACTRFQDWSVAAASITALDDVERIGGMAIITNEPATIYSHSMGESNHSDGRAEFQWHETATRTGQVSSIRIKAEISNVSIGATKTASRLSIFAVNMPKPSDVTHTIDTDTTLCVVDVWSAGNETAQNDADFSVVWDTAGVNEPLTRIHLPTRTSKSENDPHVQTWAIANPTVKTADMTFDIDGDDYTNVVVHITNYLNTKTSLGAAISFVGDDVNLVDFATCDIASGGTFGNLLHAVAAFKGTDTDPLDVSKGWSTVSTMYEDSGTAIWATHLVYTYNAPQAITWDAQGSDPDENNMGVMFEIAPAGGTVVTLFMVPNLGFDLYNGTLI